mgnify:FL=1
MDLNFTEQQQNFQKEVRIFLAENLDQEVSQKVKNGISISKSESDDWHTKLNSKGWLSGSWPKQFGGQEWGVVEKFIFEEECGKSGAPRIVPFGVGMLAPVLMKFGSKKQRDHWLPRMLSGEDWWCQGYSEPGSGSDLASLKTSAIRDNDFYIVNGQKTWTTFAQYANMIFCLVRTSREGKPQEGISFLLIDMDSPGVEVRPIITLDGSHEVNEIFFSDVKVPLENLVGEENKGWTYAKYLLTHERTGNANVAISKRKIKKLRKLATDTQKNGVALVKDPLFASRLAQIEINLQNLEITNLRTLSSVENGEAPGAESSIIKILGSEIEQDIDNLTRKSLGKRAFINEPDAFSVGYNGPEIEPQAAATASGKYFNHRKKSIYAGSNEIQKNIISKMMLNL